MDDFRILLPIEVTFRDTDALGHANNAVYLTYFENGRIAYWRRMSSGGSRYTRLPYVLARAEVDFRAPAHVGDQLTLGLRATRLGRRSFDYEYRLVRNQDRRLIAEGITVQVMYDHEAGASMPMPAQFRESLLAIDGASIR